MKNSSLPLIILILFIIPSCSCEEKKKKQKIQATEDIPTTKEVLKVKNNQSFRFKLPSNPTTGYSWRITSFDKEFITFGKETYQPDEAKKGLIGAGGWDVFTFKTHKPGKTNFTLEYKRGWEKDTPAMKQHIAEVEIE